MVLFFGGAAVTGIVAFSMMIGFLCWSLGCGTLVRYAQGLLAVQRLVLLFVARARSPLVVRIFSTRGERWRSAFSATNCSKLCIGERTDFHLN